MVRAATRADRFALVRMARDFHDAASLPFPFDAAHAERTALAMMERGGVFVRDDLRGMIGGDVAAHPFWPVRVATVALWWVDPSCRGRGLALLRAFEDWARGQGAEAVFVRAIRDDAGPLFRRLGYAPADSAYVRAC